MIRTPSDFTGYLAALAAQLPGVAHVITGEGSRQEESTKSTARYPQVLIETPEVGIPLSDEQKTLSTRVFVLDIPGGSTHAKQDIAADRAYRIAEAFVSAMRIHALSEDLGFSLTHEEIDISPVIARGSDQVRGWTFDPGILVDQSCGDFDPDTFFMPQFEVRVSGDPGAPTISITSTSIGDGETAMWWREDIAGQLQSVQELEDDTIEMDATDPASTYRVVHIWMRMTGGDIELWCYARVHSADTGGISIPFIPHYPV